MSYIYFDGYTDLVELYKDREIKMSNKQYDFGAKDNNFRLTVNPIVSGYCSYCNREKLGPEDFKAIINVGTNNEITDDRWFCEICFKKVYKVFAEMFSENFIISKDKNIKAEKWFLNPQSFLQIYKCLLIKIYLIQWIL